MPLKTITFPTAEMHYSHRKRNGLRMIQEYFADRKSEIFQVKNQ